MKLLTLILALVVFGCASSAHVLIGRARQPIAPSDVQLYSVPPPGSVDVALLNVDAAGWTTQGEMDLAIKRLKLEAAKVGANGVVVDQPSSTTNSAAGNMNPSTGAVWMGSATSTMVRAKAIFVPVR